MDSSIVINVWDVITWIAVVLVIGTVIFLAYFYHQSEKLAKLMDKYEAMLKQNQKPPK